MGRHNRKPSPALTRKRSWSIDKPPSFALKQSNDYELYRSITDFLRLCEEKKDQLYSINELQEIQQQREENRKKRRTWMITLIATLTAGAVSCLISVSLTGGVSLVALGLGAVSVVGAVASIGVNSNFKREIENERKKKQEAEADFINTLKELETRLNHVETECEELRENEGDVNERKRLHELEKKILKFKYQIISLQRLCDDQEASVFDIIDKVETIERELNNIMTLFEFTLKRLKEKYPDH